jgi:hypothetical protein
MILLGKEDILRGLRKIDALAREAGVIIDLAVYGGAALALIFDARRATRDVDAVVNGSPDFLRQAATQVAQEEQWPHDWLNDGVKGFLSTHEKLQAFGSFDANRSGGLRLYTPTPEYLFAMKCMAMRPEGIDGSHDISDIEALALNIGISSSTQALELVESFYPAARVPAKVRFGVEEIMERIAARSAASLPTQQSRSP